MRVVLVRLSPSVIEGWLSGHEMNRIETDWPEDAKIIDIWWQADRSSLVLKVVSATFDDVPEAMMIPERDVIVKSETTELSELLNLVRRKDLDDA